MKGKIVNICIGSMNILFGCLIILLTLNMPSDITLLTIQENIVVNRILLCTYVVMAFVIIIDLYQWFSYRKDVSFNVPYFLGIFVFIFIFIKNPLVGSISIISGVLILSKTFRETLVEIDSTVGISIAGLLMGAMVLIGLSSFFYQRFAQSMMKKESADLEPYKSDFFKYVTELTDITDPYINVKRGGKYGYINPRGETVIPFDYDYASPFIRITMYNKNFEVALVCSNEDGISRIIMKNKREVMSYWTESPNENYEAKIEELQDIYTNTFGQPGKMDFEVSPLIGNINKIPRYQELATDYTYRYDYTDKYDLIVTESTLGMPTKFELANKNDLNVRIQLDTKNMDYDDKYLYIFSNGYLPYYDVDTSRQGWFTQNGIKKETIGKAQILDFIDDKILIREYIGSTPQVYFIDSEERTQVSEKYNGIFIYGDKYIVKDSDNKYKVVDKEFNVLWEMEYDYLDTSLISCGLLIGMNTHDNYLKFNSFNYAEMQLDILDLEGNKILDGVEQIYSNYYKISSDKSVSYANRYQEFISNIRKLDYKFVGDKFYTEYLEK